MRKYLENKIIKSVSRLDIDPDDFRLNFSNPKADFTRKLHEGEPEAWFRRRFRQAFRQLKYDDCSSFSNTRKKVAAIGEIILSLIFHNICTSVLVAFWRKLFRRRRNRKLLYKVSYSDLAKTLRLYASGRDPTITIQKIVKVLEMTIQPVRNERVFSRILKPRSSTEQLDFLYCRGNPSLAQFKMFAGSDHHAPNNNFETENESYQVRNVGF